MTDSAHPRRTAAKPIGIWLRVSTEDQARGDSPEHHEKRARLYAEAKAWRIMEIYDLSGVSGKSVFDHPETQRMLADIKSGRITGLIFSKMARLARNTRELLELSDIFRSFGADLISLNEAIDTTSPAGRLFYTMIAALAQWEREEIADRVAASVPIRAKLGKQLGGSAPFGYRWKDKHLVLEPAEAKVRRRVFELFLDLRRKQAVVRALNAQGYRTRSGSPFTVPTVDRLLRDPVAKGLHRSNYTTQSKDGLRWILKPESEWVFNQVEPIVSAEIWDACNAILDAEAKRWQRGPRPAHPFAGLIFCQCGEPMAARPKLRQFSCGRCRNTIDIAEIETTYRSQLGGLGAEAGLPPPPAGEKPDAAAAPNSPRAERKRHGLHH